MYYIMSTIPPEPLHIRSLIPYEYTVCEYIGGHIATYVNKLTELKNPKWLCVKDSIYYLLMFCEKNTFCILCNKSLDIINKYNELNKKPITWYKLQNGYIAGRLNRKLLMIHQIIMNCYGNGKGTGKLSVDHIDRNPLNNSLDNLRIATREMQEQNSKGILEGTKRARQQNARALPPKITQDMMRKYMVYNVNVYNKEKNSTRDYFSIEQHPKLPKIWESSKSMKISIVDKYNATIKVLDDLEHDIYPVANVRTNPPHMRITKCGTKEILVFDWKKKDIRMNARFELPTDKYDIEEQYQKMRNIIEKKYGEKSYI